MSKTLVKKLEVSGREELSEEQKKEFLDDHAKHVGEIIEDYKNLKCRSLEKARYRLIGYYS